MDNSYTVTCLVTELAPDSPAGGGKNRAVGRKAWALGVAEKLQQWQSHSAILRQGLQCSSILFGHAPFLSFICEPTHNQMHKRKSFGHVLSLTGIA